MNTFEIVHMPFGQWLTQLIKSFNWYFSGSLFSSAHERNLKNTFYVIKAKICAFKYKNRSSSRYHNQIAASQPTSVTITLEARHKSIVIHSKLNSTSWLLDFSDILYCTCESGLALLYNKIMCSDTKDCCKKPWNHYRQASRQLCCLKRPLRE